MCAVERGKQFHARAWASLTQINVKASSPEGVGALGRGEGIGASAVVLLSVLLGAAVPSDTVGVTAPMPAT